MRTRSDLEKGERWNVGLQIDQQAHQCGQGQAVPKDRPEDGAFLAVETGGRASAAPARSSFFRFQRFIAASEV